MKQRVAECIVGTKRATWLGIPHSTHTYWQDQSTIYESSSVIRRNLLSSRFMIVAQFHRESSLSTFFLAVKNKNLFHISVLLDPAFISDSQPPHSTVMLSLSLSLSLSRRLWLRACQFAVICSNWDFFQFIPISF